MVRQPKGSHICGQVAVSNLTGRPLKEVVSLVGHAHGTKTKELVKVLRKLGFSCKNKCVRCRGLVPPNALLQLHEDGDKRHWHWLAMKNGRILDGATMKSSKDEFDINLFSGAVITSYLEVWKGRRYAV